MSKLAPISLAIAAALAITACGQKSEPEPSATDNSTTETAAAPVASSTSDDSSMASSDKQAYFGNLHIHTSWSFDGYTNGSPTSPEDAYRWAKGEAIPATKEGGMMKIKKPLDWYAVSDHAEYMGVFKNMEDPDSPFSKLDIAKEITSEDSAVAFKAFAKILDDMNKGKSDPQLSDPEMAKSMWQEIIDIAEQHNEPGSFTTFAAFEWTSAPNNRNLHRVVIFNGSEGIPEMPFSTLDSNKPEDLWKYMNTARDSGAELLAVPHNGNASDGMMFELTDSYGNEITKEYSENRIKNEPVYEISQIKGTSETHPDLSPNDEFADFELWDYTLSAITERPTKRQGSYLRQAYLDGIRMEMNDQGNPFKYGVIGDSDTHNSAASVEEDNYTGKFAGEFNKEHRLKGIPGYEEASKQQIREFSSGGLAGVWAEENTRDAIFNAMARKETFGTSGTRMQVRVFASFEYDDNILDSEDWVNMAYDKGVPMGSELSGASDNSPVLIIQAMKEADGANLDRAQVIKGWVDSEGNAQEKIFDVALSDDRTDGSEMLESTVDLKTGKYTNDIGASSFLVTWKDPEFDPAQHAFYYVRVLEIPTPRWSTLDAIALGQEIRDDLPATIQERAWSSPIWYSAE
ncbi:DUF3604 domain-containing protein [Thalassotalea sp. PS06]|uniref:DUF3604 domain-containing protein n=1 Tax=Thalassotalea sp. PS06 TaxID=2594005 RepID=UPI001161E5EC|nr:DUF3604 domain-containing protein [Thalassotalea sp. PS06]QDP01596.1 DUF3604 domain-containing protein [Thalassotalea sp. PS06]